MIIIYKEMDDFACRFFFRIVIIHRDKLALRICLDRLDLRNTVLANAGECISTHAPLAGRDSKRVQITMHIFAITDKFQMLLHRMPTVRAFCSFLMQENHADFGCEPPK